jgi:hypothetical protein
LWSNTVTMPACAEPTDIPRTERTHAAAVSGMRLSIGADDMFGRRVFCTLPCVAAPGLILRRVLLIATTLVTAVVVAGCGGDAPKQASGAPGSAAAEHLLAQAFEGHHAINSGVIKLDLELVPSGSSSITKPIELSFGGPFMNRGAGKPPASDFTISIAAQGHYADLQVISAGGKGYITVSGQSYRMPASSFKNLESGFGSLASSGTASSSKSGAFAKLGIKPLHWLVSPQLVGSANLDGVKTTEIRAGLDARAMLQDFSKLLGKAGSLGLTGASKTLPQSIPPATQSSIAHALGSPSFNIWTGAADRIIRKLTVAATIPVSGHTRGLLGGMRSARVSLDFEYSHLNQPQTITAPTVTKPYSVFRAEVTAVLQEIDGGLTNGALSGRAGALSADQKYTQCITTAAGDVAKMQKCAKLLGGG